MAVSGHNGNNESFIGMSASISLEIYDQNMNEIRMAESRMPIDLIIRRDSNLPEYPFQYVNISEIKLSTSYLNNAFSLIADNASIHIELKPLNWTLAYLVVIKLGYTPILNSTYADFTSFKIFCPSREFYQFEYIFINLFV